MKRTIILDSERLEIDIKYISYHNEVLGVPRQGELWNRLAVARGTRLELEAVTTDGRRIAGVFRLIGRTEDGALEVEPWSDRDKLGGGQV